MVGRPMRTSITSALKNMVMMMMGMSGEKSAGGLFGGSCDIKFAEDLFEGLLAFAGETFLLPEVPFFGEEEIVGVGDAEFGGGDVDLPPPDADLPARLVKKGTPGTGTPFLFPPLGDDAKFHVVEGFTRE